MTRMRAVLTLTLLAFAAPLAAQAGTGNPSGTPPAPAARPRVPQAGAERRQQLQQLVLSRFMDRVQQQLSLSAADRQRLEQVLARNEGQRRELAQQARGVRQELAGAAQDPGTPQAEYDRLLKRMSDLRARELELWQSEQNDLAQVLNPRQRAQFMALRLEFMDRVQRLAAQRRMRQQQMGRFPQRPVAPPDRMPPE